MSWDDAEQDYKQNRNANTKFFKLEDDGDQANIIFLSAPVATEQGPNARGETWTSYVTDIYNIDTGKKQEWSMGASAFKAALGLKRAIGAERLAGSAISVVRNGKAGDTKTSYTMIPVGPVDDDLAAELGITPAAAPARRAGGAAAARPAAGAAAQRGPAPGMGDDRAFPSINLSAINAAGSLDALNAAVGEQWEKAEGDATLEGQITTAAKARKEQLEKPAQAATRRAPSF